MKDFFKTADYFRSIPHDTFKMYGLGHIIVIAIMFLICALIIVFSKRFSRKGIDIYLKISSIFWICLEIFKIVLFFSITNDTMQAWREVLPLYLCSLYVFCLPLVAFAKGFLKQIGEYALVVLCLLSGTLTVFNCPALLNYPFFSFFALHSLFYHVAMPCTGILLLFTKYVNIEFKRFYLPMIMVLLLSIPAIIVNNLFNTDYMLLRYAWGTPILSEIATKIGQPLQISIMLTIYLLICILMSAILSKLKSKLLD